MVAHISLVVAIRREGTCRARAADADAPVEVLQVILAADEVPASKLHPDGHSAALKNQARCPLAGTGQAAGNRPQADFCLAELLACSQAPSGPQTSETELSTVESHTTV